MKRLRQKKAFTLIEMLVVLVIIGILVGMVFKMMAFATRQAATADTIAVLEKLSNALTEFRAEYGHFPPTDCSEYVYEDTRMQDPNVVSYMHTDNTNELFRFGLVSYLYPRIHNRWEMSLEHTNGTETLREPWVGDTARDRAAKSRWAHLLPDLHHTTLEYGMEDFGASYKNSMRYVRDAWKRKIRYRSEPPYQTYELWSVGPDGRNNTADDIHKDGWDEQG